MKQTTLKKKYFLSVIIMLFMGLAMIHGVSQPAYADEIFINNATGLQSAFDVGGEPKLVADFSSDDLTVPEGKLVVLDLNGYTLKILGTLKNEGDLTIIDTSKNETGKMITETAVPMLINAGSLTIESGTFERIGGKQHYILDNNGIFPGTDKNNPDPNEVTATINGGTFINILASATLRNHGTMEITDANISNTGTGIAVKNEGNSDLLITGGEFTSNGSALQNSGTVTIDDGNFTGNAPNGRAIYQLGFNNFECDLTINDGTFSGAANSFVFDLRFSQGASIYTQINGGTFSGEIKTVYPENIPEGAEIKVEQNINLSAVDGSTVVTTPEVDQELLAVVKSDICDCEGLSADDHVEFNWYYEDDPYTSIGTDPVYTVSEDDIGKVICLEVTVLGKTSTWKAVDAVGPISVTDVSILSKPAIYVWRADKTKNRPLQLKASVLPDKAADKTVTWRTDRESIASVNASGLVTFKGVEGTVRITAASGKGADYVDIDVVKNVTTIDTSMTTKYIQSGKSLGLPTAIYDGNTQIKADLTWGSSNPKIVTVSKKGVVKAGKNVKSGMAVITAKSGNGKTLRINIIVSDKAVKLKKAVVKAPTTLTVGKTKKVSIKLVPQKATGINITFKSSNPSGLSVDQAGNLTAKKKGKYTIKINVGSKTVKKTVRVK